jgi:hypothetical protein
MRRVLVVIASLLPGVILAAPAIGQRAVLGRGPDGSDTVVAGWNDYCLTDLGAGWQGFAYSTDSGESWTDSPVPGYPQDTSAEGQKSPLYGDHTDAGDPIAAFDNAGNLFVGRIAFNRMGPVNGDVYVATYGTNPVGDYPVDYQRTRIVGEGTPTRGLVSWTDNRDVVPGTDPREIEEQDGFDVLQGRVDLAENTRSRDEDPLARRALYRRQLRQWRRPRPEHLR